MNRELTRVTVVVLIAFLAIGVSSAFWSVIQAKSLLARSDNARNVIEQERIQRGAIVDRNGERLAYTVENEDGTARRVYPYPEAAGAVGYYSFTYGTAGIEAAYDTQLRGDPWRTAWSAFVDHTLHRPEQGGDVQTTLDLGVQQAAATALGDRRGAVIVVEVPTGRVLAMVSAPGYDPNQLDQNWEQLTQDKQTTPLLNRVTAGLYQPGGALETVVLSSILSTNPDLKASGEAILNSEAPDARDPVDVNGLTLACLDGVPHQGPLTLAQAYVFACPAPFAHATGEALTPETIWDRFNLFGLLTAPELAGFETAVSSPRRLNGQTAPDVLQAALVGQGNLTVTPLQMAEVIAVVANRGNEVPFYLVDAIRPPDAKNWQVVKIPVDQPALLRVDVVAVLRLAMLQGAAQSPSVSRARRGGLVLYGHSAIAYGGPEATPYAWFTGFVDQTEGDQMAAIVAVVVIEDEGDPGAAADVAGAAFAAAAGIRPDTNE
jgi:peptidoglycan glycosyltransferase